MKEKKFSDSGPIYAFTTENLSGYFNSINFSGKSVLCLCGSGDHLINAFYHGARSVDVFDLNSHAFHYLELKLTALKILGHDEFKGFLYRNTGALNPSVFEKLVPSLSVQTHSFWQKHYDDFSDSGDQIRESDLFNTRFDHDADKGRFNDYLSSPHSYKMASARVNLKQITRWYCNLKALPGLLNNNIYDVVLFSNLADYLEEIFCKSNNPLLAYVHFLNQFKIHLKYRGIIVAAYLYDVQGKDKHGVIDDQQLRNRAFAALDYKAKQIMFPGVFPEKQDAVIMLSPH